MTNDTRAAYEAWLDEIACEGLPVTRRSAYPPSVQEWGFSFWQPAYLASRRAALEESIDECERLLEHAGNEDQSGLVVAINAIRALADEGVKL